ncbi:dienelactone hydrolase [Massilia arenosa]|uniref:Dienelactone hydrolase n=1 Tax=Zemynaea arenosa TaxID=2561931 RepID=A0A4Y9S3J3_9BURK|nr:dienelactone hydrolase family protein [Massilia arenosa]TFW15878.1 dienelactone hydrolase [Massilia arenosa]
MRGLLVLLFLLSISHVHAEEGFAHLQSGPLPVGWKVVQQYDTTRAYRGQFDAVTGQPVKGERARPMQMLVWYPAQKSANRSTYADYVRTQATDEDFSVTGKAANGFVDTQLKAASATIGANAAHAAFGQRMWAERDAAPRSGKYPVVLYAAGVGGVAHEAADIAEYLASRGYVVIASRSLGTRAALMNADAEGLESQAGDIEYLLSYATTLPQADMAHVAAIGWSWGGLANVFAAVRDNRIGALVSFDGTREPEHTRRIPPEQLTVPWLYVQRHPQTVSQLSRAGIETSFSLLNEARYADVYQLTMYPMQHVDFSSALLRFQRPAAFTEYARSEVVEAYGWTVRYVLAFLDAHMKNDAQAVAFLGQAPVRNGVPAHMARIERTPAEKGPVPSREGLAAALNQQGFAHAEEIYGAMHKARPTFSLSERDINSWGYDLLAADADRSKALAIFKLGISLYPESANLHDSLGEAFEVARDVPQALASYRRSLSLNPANTHASTRITALTASTSATH